MTRKRLALFGGGPACLLAALKLSKYHEVHLYEKGKTIGRKFLVAGKGGFNLTNKLTGEQLIDKYSAAAAIEILKKALTAFDSDATRRWLAELGIETFVGSSGRVFPKKVIKPAEVLQKIKIKLIENGVVFHLNHQFVDFDESARPVVENNEGRQTVLADHYFFGLGGGSWSKTGSNSNWFGPFDKIGIEPRVFQPSNCGIQIDWNSEFAEKYAGTPLKNIGVKTKEGYLKGEALITRYGLEGNVIYPVSAVLRNELQTKGNAQILLDFKPNNTTERLVAKVRNKNVLPKNYGYVFNLDKASMGIVKQQLDKPSFLDPKKVAKLLKQLPITVLGLRSVEESISTVGGISMDKINDRFELKAHPHISVIGEMLDWDAPTGGFLLQGCFSTGYAASMAWIINKNK